MTTADEKMLSTDKHCEMLTDHIRDRNSAVMDGFKLYVQMFSAIVGGSVLLRLQYGSQIPASFAALADALTGLVFIMVAVIIIESRRSWYQYRIVLSKVAGLDGAGKPIIEPPKIWSSMKIELLMLAVMAIAWVIFHAFNPLRL